MKDPSAFILDTPALRTVRNKCLLLQVTQPVVFHVTVAERLGHLVKQAQGIKEEEEKRSGSLEIVGHVLGAQMMDSSRDQSPGATQQSQDFYTRSSQNAQ